MNKETCSSCGGSGKVNGAVCPVCKGSGKIIKQSGPMRGTRG